MIEKIIIAVRLILKLATRCMLTKLSSGLGLANMSDEFGAHTKRFAWLSEQDRP